MTELDTPARDDDILQLQADEIEQVSGGTTGSASWSTDWLKLYASGPPPVRGLRSWGRVGPA